GVSGADFTDNFNQHISSSITSTGQRLIKKVKGYISDYNKKILKKKMFEVIYGDTDSNMVRRILNDEELKMRENEEGFRKLLCIIWKDGEKLRDYVNKR